MTIKIPLWTEDEYKIFKINSIPVFRGPTDTETLTFKNQKVPISDYQFFISQNEKTTGLSDCKIRNSYIVIFLELTYSTFSFILLFL